LGKTPNESDEVPSNELVENLACVR
jgi:hypothetical protein